LPGSRSLRTGVSKRPLTSLVLILLMTILALLLPRSRPTYAADEDPRLFPQTGFRVADDRFWDYFQHRGNIRTFGYPVSNSFQLLGSKVQIFQRQIMQLRSDGSVTTLNLLDAGLMPYTHINQSTFPATDTLLITSAPNPASATYATEVLDFVRAHAPDTVLGRQPNFGQTFFLQVTQQDAFPPGGDLGLLPLMDLEMLGIPTSMPALDPANNKFLYLRFQRGILQYDQTSGLTQGLLLADYFKSILTGLNLPPDLALAASGSRFYLQYNPSLPMGLNRPQDLAGTDLTGAFVQTVIGSDASQVATPYALPTTTPTVTPTATATAVGDTCSGDELMRFAGASTANIGDTVLISITSSRNHTNVVVTGTDNPVFLRVRSGQTGYVWDYQVVIKTPGRHDYTFYVDTIIPCTANFFTTPNIVPTSTATIMPTQTSTSTPTPSPTATNTATTTPTATQSPPATITGFNPPPPGNGGQLITILGAGFGPTQGPTGAVYFITTSSTATGGSSPTPGSVQTVTVRNWSDTAMVVQLPTTPGTYRVQVFANNSTGGSNVVPYTVQ